MNFAPISAGRPAVLPFKSANPQIRFGHEGHEHEKPAAAAPEKPATEATAPASKKKPGLLRNPLGVLILGLLGLGGYEGYQALKPAEKPQPTVESCQAQGGTFVTHTEFNKDGSTTRTSECVPKGQPIQIGPGGSTEITIQIPKDVQEAIKNLQQQPK